jgi:hypothetical protein
MGRVSYVKKREMHVVGARLVSQEKGDTHYGGTCPFYLTPQKDCKQNILHGVLLTPVLNGALRLLCV